MSRKIREISSRARAFPASPIRKLVPMADQAKARGVKVFHLNIGQPDLDTPPELLAAVKGYSKSLVAYSPSHGENDCLDFMLDYYRRQVGLELKGAEVNITTGGSEAVLFAFLAAANPGDEILVFEPFYTNYRSLADMAGLKLVAIPTVAEDGYHLPGRDVIERAIGPNTAALILCNPNNPTGTVYTPAELEMVAGIVRDHGLFWISDEVYREFVYGDVQARSAMTFPGLESQVIVVDSISKRFSACGARVGALVSRNKDLMSAVLRLAQARLSSPTFGQVLASAGKLVPASYFESVRREYQRRRDLLHRELNAIPGVFSKCPEGAFYTMARLPVRDAETFATWLLTDFQMNGATVMVAPGAGFYATPDQGTTEVRIAYVLEVGALGEAVRILREALNQYPLRTDPREAPMAAYAGDSVAGP